MSENVLDRIVELFPNRISENINLEPYRDESYKPRVKNAIEYKDALMERLKQKSIYGDKTGFVTDNYFRFRPFELTIWTGYKGHGKSALLSQVLLKFMQSHKRVFVCSPEFHPVELLYRFLIQVLASNDPSEEEAEFLIDYLSKWLWVYDVQSSLKPNDVPALCRWVCENIKPDHIVIDSLMKCGLAPDDYAGQKRLVDQIQSVAHQNPVHIHVVAHARKGSSDDKPAKLHDVKGASEIADLAENVISVWRNKPKEQALSMGDMRMDGDHDAMMLIEAQRNCGGQIGTLPLYFDRNSTLFFELGHSFRDYVSIGRVEVSL